MAKKRLSIKQTWWWSKTIQDRLTIWAKMQLEHLTARYTFRYEEEGTGFHDPKNHVIQVNCQLFKTDRVATQFKVTQAILSHEAGHAINTGEMPDRQNNALFEMVNILEDEREERCQVIRFPGLAELFALLAGKFWKNTRPYGYMGDQEQAYSLCLHWRFAYRFVTEPAMLKHLGVTPGTRSYWERIKPLVEEAWGAKDVYEVKDI